MLSNTSEQLSPVKSIKQNRLNLTIKIQQPSYDHKKV